MQHVDDLDDDRQSVLCDAVFVGRATRPLGVVLDENGRPLRGELPVPLADGRSLLRDDDDELFADNDDHNADAPRLLGFVRLLVASLGFVLEADEQRVRDRRRRLLLRGPVLFGERLRPDDRSLYGPGDLDDDNDAGPLLVLLLVDDVLDVDHNDDAEPVFAELRLQVVDGRLELVQGPRPLRGELPVSLAVDDMVGRRVRSRGRSVRGNDDHNDDDLDLVDNCLRRLLLSYAERDELRHDSRNLRTIPSRRRLAWLWYDLRRSRRSVYDHNDNDDDNNLDNDDDAPLRVVYLGAGLPRLGCHR